MLRCGRGGAGGGYTVLGSQGERSVEHEILSAFRCEIIRMSLAVRGQVKVWNGSTVGADGTVRLAGGRGRG